jgi:hypothetical protein
MWKDQEFLSTEDDDNGGGDASMKPCSHVLELPEVAKPNGKRPRPRGHRNSRWFKKRKAADQTFAKDIGRHAEKARYATTALQVEGLKHSGSAWAGNLGRCGGVVLPQELGSGYRLLRHKPG